MYMQEALEAVCKKRKLKPNEYALLVRDMSILIPLDRTVASLEGKSDLVLVMRSSLPRYGIVDTGRSMRTTDPNGKSPEGSFSLFREGLTRLLIFPSFFTASIFKRMSETPGEQNSVTDYMGAYKVRFGRLSLSVFDLKRSRRNMLSPGSCPCLWEGTRGFWRSMGFIFTYVPFPTHPQPGR